MIWAGPDGPGGGPDELDARLVAAQGRMSGWGSGRPGRVRTSGQGPDGPASGGSFGCLRGELAGSSGPGSGSSG